MHFAIWKFQHIESLPGMRAHDVTSTQFTSVRGVAGTVQYDLEREVAMIEFKGELEACPFSELPGKLKELRARG